MAWCHQATSHYLSQCWLRPRLPHGFPRPQWVNSLRPSDAIWRQWSWTTLAQVMACCLMAPSHYLNQCWLIIRGVLWHTSESSFAGIAQGIDSGYEFEKYILKNIFKSPRGQWVNIVFSISSAEMLHQQYAKWVIWVNAFIRYGNSETWSTNNIVVLMW